MGGNLTLNKRYLLPVLLLFVPTASWGFVERLSPYGGPIPCHQVGAYMIEIVAAKLARENVESKIAQVFKVSLTGQDRTDTQAVIDYVLAPGQPAERNMRAHRVEGLCGLAEIGEPSVSTPGGYRQELGIAAP